jgi:hypothetical protein
VEASSRQNIRQSQDKCQVFLPIDKQCAHCGFVPFDSVDYHQYGYALVHGGHTFWKTEHNSDSDCGHIFTSVLVVKTCDV